MKIEKITIYTSTTAWGTALDAVMNKKVVRTLERMGVLVLDSEVEDIYPVKTAQTTKESN